MFGLGPVSFQSGVENQKWAAKVGADRRDAPRFRRVARLRLGKAGAKVGRFGETTQPVFILRTFVCALYYGSRQRLAVSTLRLARAIADRRFWPEISADHRRRQKHPREVRTRRPHALHPKCGCRVSCCGGTTNGIAP